MTKHTEKRKVHKKVVKKKPQPKSDVEMDDLKHFTGLDGQKYPISLKQRNFCEKYLLLYGNGAEAVIEAGYDVYYRDKSGVPTTNINYAMARVIASQNLTKLNIIAYITLKLQKYGYDDKNITKQHLFLINQFADFSAKAKAIDMYYKISGSYSAEKVEHSVDKKLEEALERLSKLLPD